MNWKDYQEKCKETLCYRSYKEMIACSTLELVDELKEFDDHMSSGIADEKLLKLELGDITYGMAILSDHYGLTIDKEPILPELIELGWEDYIGNICGIIKKTIRDDNYILTNTKNRRVLLEENLSGLYTAIRLFCGVERWNLSDILQMNIEKLFDRKERGVLQGSGDER